MSVSLSWPAGFALCGVLTACSADAPPDAPPVTDAAPDTASSVDGANPSDAGDSSAPLDSGGSLYAKAWAFGDDATRLYFDGAAWTVDSSHPAPDGGKTTSYLGAWRGPSSLWAVGSNFLVERYHAGAWASLPSPKGVGVDGGSPSQESGALAGVWGSSESDVWVVESNPFPNSRSFLHWDGSTWTRSDDVVTGYFMAIYGVASDDIWAAGNNGVTTTLVIAHYDGSHWKVQTGLTDNAFTVPGLIGFAHDDFWVGAMRNISRWDGNSWTTSLGGGVGVSSFYGTSDGDLWAAASGNTLHYDGSKWTPSPTKVIAGVLALGGVTTADMWAVGLQGAAAHHDGSSWTAYTTGVSGRLNAVLGVPEGFGQ